MADSKQLPATKHDLRALESRMTKHFDGKLAKVIAESEANILRHFDLTVETIRHDLLGANADEIATLKDRVTRIETHFGLSPA